MNIYQEINKEINNIIMNSNKKYLTVKKVRNVFEQESNLHIKEKVLINYVWRSLKRLEKKGQIKLIKETSPKIYKKKKRK